MDVDTVRHDTVAATDEANAQAIARIGRFLAGDVSYAAQFIAPTGEHVHIPQPLYDALRQVTASLAQGEALTLIPCSLYDEVTIDEAATLLGVSAQSVAAKLDDGTIPSSGEGAQRCIRLRDLVAYKARLRALHKEDLSELARLSQEFGLYD